MKSSKHPLSRWLAAFLCVVLFAALLSVAGLAEDYTAINVTYNHQGIRADVGMELTLKVKTDLPAEQVSQTPSYQWHKVIGIFDTIGDAIPGATGTCYTVPTDEIGLVFYYCVVTAELNDGRTVSSQDGNGTMTWVNVQNLGEGFDVYTDGEFDTYFAHSSEEEILLGFGQMNYENKDITYQWYECDAEGFPMGEALSGDGVFLIDGIPESMLLQPIYYKCVATAVGQDLWVEKDEVVCSAVLYPADAQGPIPFTDVPEGEWYHSSVVSAYHLGLISGKTATAYCPEDNVTNAEVVKLAVCMNILCHGGDPENDIGNGSPWYKTYMDYAVEQNIIMYDMSETADNTASRDVFVYILSHALPEEAFAPVNTIPDGSIPDVSAPGAELDSVERSIYQFYRAGILNGSDDMGTFNPASPIKRSEVAAILIRMMDPSFRVEAPEALGK